MKPSHDSRAKQLSAPRVIVGQRIGRLGNQIQLLANLLAMHQATGISFSHPTLGEYGSYFRGTKDDFLVRYPRISRPLTGITSARLASYLTIRILHRLRILGRSSGHHSLTVDHREVVELSEEKLVHRIREAGHLWLFGGWIYRYTPIKQEFFEGARSFFDLAEPHNSAVTRIVASARAGAEMLIGVHVRQTDFRHHEGGKFYFTTEEYACLLKQIRGLFAGRTVKFLIVSDEPKERAQFPEIECSFSSGVPIEDMYAMGGCDYLVGSHASSFSLWPAFLNQIPIYRILDTGRPISLEDFKPTTIDWQLVD